MKLTRIEQNEDKTYSIMFDEDFYTHFKAYYVKSSFYNIFYRLFGLLPQDFYHYLGAAYNASFKPSPIIPGTIYTLFKNKSDAINFANEVDRRLEVIIQRKDFQ